MPFLRRRGRLKFFGLVVVLCILVALASLAVTWFMCSFYSYDPQYYYPTTGLEREEWLQRQQEEQKKR